MKTRSNTLELLDADNIPDMDLIQNLKELKFINTFLGGHKTLFQGFDSFEKMKSGINVLEIGSGGGDNLIALKKRFPKNSYTGLDLKQTCIDFSKNQDNIIQWICENAFTYAPEKPIDLIFNSLFCHHFKDDELVVLLKWMKKNAKLGFVIGDLHRHWLAYWSIRTLTALFSKSYLVKNDAPLSVLRGFKRKEWEILLEKAGIENYKIKWCWAFRHLIVIKN
jgi:SAM-dependent methyltransferase